jgi:hypothetical protein
MSQRTDSKQRLDCVLDVSGVSQLIHKMSHKGSWNAFLRLVMKCKLTCEQLRCVQIVEADKAHSSCICSAIG